MKQVITYQASFQNGGTKLQPSVLSIGSLRKIRGLDLSFEIKEFIAVNGEKL